MSDKNERLESDAEILSEARSQPKDLASTVSPEEQRLHLKELEDNLNRESDVHAWRKHVLIGLCVFLGVWSVFVFVAVFFLAESVAIALLTTTLGHVLGLTAIAFNWLFPKK